MLLVSSQFSFHVDVHSALAIQHLMNRCHHTVKLNGIISVFAFGHWLSMPMTRERRAWNNEHHKIKWFVMHAGTSETPLSSPRPEQNKFNMGTCHSSIMHSVIRGRGHRGTKELASCTFIKIVYSIMQRKNSWGSLIRTSSVELKFMVIGFALYCRDLHKLNGSFYEHAKHAKCEVVNIVQFFWQIYIFSIAPATRRGQKNVIGNLFTSICRPSFQLSDKLN